jgi:hypothetical protein
MTENSRNDLNINELKPILRNIKDNPNLIDSNSIKFIIFGYDLTKNNGVFEAKIYRKKIPLGDDVRQSIMDEIIKKLDYLTQEEIEFINWASSTNQNNFIVEVTDIDFIDYDLRKIILNTDVNEWLSNIKEIDGWKHKGLLTIIDINEYGKLIGISSIREKKVAHKKKNLISLENIEHGQVSLKFVSDIKLFSITDLFDAIYFMNKIILINEEEVNKIFVLNKYFSDKYQKNIDLISKFINNPDELYRKILGNFRMQKKMITIIDYVLKKKEVDPSMFKTKAQEFEDLFDEKIQFDENSKIDISNSDLQKTLELLSQSFDFAPITGEKRKVSPYYK